MTKKEGQAPVWTDTPTKKLDFGKWGKWTVRGLLADEDFNLQDKYMTVDGRTGKTSIDTSGMRIAQMQLCTLDSPDGVSPPTNKLAKLPAGMASRILSVSKELSNPEVEEEKN